MAKTPLHLLTFCFAIMTVAEGAATAGRLFERFDSLDGKLYSQYELFTTTLAPTQVSGWLVSFNCNRGVA